MPKSHRIGLVSEMRFGETGMKVRSDGAIVTRHNTVKNWTEWAKCWLMIVKPIGLYRDTIMSKPYSNYLDLVGSKSLVYAGIGPVYFGYPVTVNQDQMTIAVLKGGAGSAIFAALNILGNEEFERALELSASYIPRLSPESAPQVLLDEGLSYILDKMDRIYNRDLQFNNIETIKTILTNVLAIELTRLSDAKSGRRIG